MDKSNSDLEKVIKEKVEPIVNESMQKYLGITIKELPDDISDKIEKNPIISYGISTEFDFKTAKKMFKAEFLKRLLQTHLGNISKVAEITGLDRRTIHRDIKNLNIDIKKIREDLISTQYYQKEAVDNIVRKTLDDYKNIINSEKLKNMYKDVERISDMISNVLPTIEMSWDMAEKAFEKEYIKKSLEESNYNISLTAKKIGIRYETLHRKIKALDIK